MTYHGSNYDGPFPQGVPNPYTPRIHNWPTRFHGPIYARPMTKTPERRTTFEWNWGPEGYGDPPAAGLGFLDDVTFYWSARSGAGPDPQVKAYQDQINVQLVAQGYAPITADGHLGAGTCGAVKALTEDGVAGLAMPKACTTFKAPTRVSAPVQQAQPAQQQTADEPKPVASAGGTIPAPPSPWTWPNFASGGATYQTAINAELARLGYAKIGVDGKLGAGTCGATELLKSKGVAVTPPAACYPAPAYGVKGADGRYRMWQEKTLGKSYPLPAFVGVPKQQTADEPKKVATEEPKKTAAPTCFIEYGKKSDLTTKVQKWMNVGLAKNGYNAIPVTGVFDAKTAGVIRLIKGADPACIAGAGTPPCDPLQWPKANDDQIAVAPVPTKKKVAAPIACKAGTKLSGGKCVKITCKTGYVLKGNDCVKKAVAKTPPKPAPVKTVTFGPADQPKKQAAAPIKPAPVQEASMFGGPMVWLGAAAVVGVGAVVILGLRKKKAA